MTAYSYTVGASGADYTSFITAVGARQSTAASGDTIEFVLLDATCEAATFLNYDRGITITVRSANKFDGRWGGGTKITSTDHGLRFLGVSPDAGDPWQHVVCEDLWWDADDFNAYYQMTAHQAGSVDRIATYRNCGFRDYKNNVGGLVLYGDSASRTNTLNLISCVFWGRRERACESASNTGSGQSWTVTQERCTFYDSHWSVVRNANLNLTITSRASIVKPYSTAAEVVTSSSGGTLTLNSEVCAFSRSQTDVEGLWDVNDADLYAITMVTGNPAPGQIGFVDISTGDFRLYADADNVAIDGASGVTGLPTHDIAGDPVDADPDIGAFEVQPSGTTLTPAPATYEFNTPAATVARTEHVTLTPVPASYEFSRPAPSVTVTDHVTLAPGPALYEFSRPAPLVGITDHILLAPAPAYYEFANPVPAVTVGAGIVLTPGPASYEFSRPAALVGITDHITLTPAPALYEFSGPAPLVLAGGLPTVTAGIWSVPVRLAAGDEWMLVATGPAADAPRMRVTMRFRE